LYHKIVDIKLAILLREISYQKLFFTFAIFTFCDHCVPINVVHFLTAQELRDAQLLLSWIYGSQALINLTSSS